MAEREEGAEEEEEEEANERHFRAAVRILYRASAAPAGNLSTERVLPSGSRSQPSSFPSLYYVAVRFRHLKRLTDLYICVHAWREKRSRRSQSIFVTYAHKHTNSELKTASNFGGLYACISRSVLGVYTLCVCV